MRLSVMASAAALALAACAGQNAAVPVASNAMTAPIQNSFATQMGVDAVTTCATSPPQYDWIFKGACDPKITVKPTGGSFALGAYDDISIKGSIGENNAKGSAIVALADATNTNGDIEKDKGTAFPLYHGEGKTFLYAVAINQSAQTLKPIAKKGKPILQYIITDTKGLPGTK